MASRPSPGHARSRLTWAIAKRGAGGFRVLGAGKPHPFGKGAVFLPCLQGLASVARGEGQRALSATWGVRTEGQLGTES